MSILEVLVIVSVVSSAVFVLRRASRSDITVGAGLPWLLPEGFVSAMESIARGYPLRYVLLVFLAWLGICALGVEVGASFGPWVQYGVGALVSLMAVYSARARANARAS